MDPPEARLPSAVSGNPTSFAIQSRIRSSIATDPGPTKLTPAYSLVTAAM